MLTTLKLLALLGIFTLVGLIGWASVKDVAAGNARRALGKIISGTGLLTWGLLGASMFPREQFATTADWGIFIVGGLLILIGAVLGDQMRHAPRRLVAPVCGWRRGC